MDKVLISFTLSIILFLCMVDLFREDSGDH